MVLRCEQTNTVDIWLFILVCIWLNCRSISDSMTFSSDAVVRSGLWTPRFSVFNENTSCVWPLINSLLNITHHHFITNKQHPLSPLLKRQFTQKLLISFLSCVCKSFFSGTQQKTFREGFAFIRCLIMDILLNILCCSVWIELCVQWCWWCRAGWSHHMLILLSEFKQ